MVNFGVQRTQVCRRCSKKLLVADFESDRAMLLLGRPYCSGCLGDTQHACHACKKALRQSDFQSGRAMTLGTDLTCDGCLEGSLKTLRPAAILPPPLLKCLDHRELNPVWPVPSIVPAALPPGIDVESRRATFRFIPPQDCTLVVRPSGLRRLFGGNVVRLWVDVSEGGLRVILLGRYKEGNVIQGQFVHASLTNNLAFRAQVRYSKAAEKFPGCTLIGLRFEKAAADLMPFIRGVLGQNITPA